MEAFDELINGPLAEFMTASAGVGEDVAEQVSTTRRLEPAMFAAAPSAKHRQSAHKSSPLPPPPPPF